MTGTTSPEKLDAQKRKYIENRRIREAARKALVSTPDQGSSSTSFPTNPRPVATQTAGAGPSRLRNGTCALLSR